MAETLAKLALIKDKGIQEKLERAFRFTEKLVEGKTTEQKQLEKLLTSSPAKPVQIACENRLKQIGTASTMSDQDIINGIKSLGFTVAEVTRHGLRKIINQTQYSETHKKEAVPSADPAGSVTGPR